MTTVKFRKAFRGMCALILILSSLCGCYSHSTRSDYLIPTEEESDAIPVIADTEEPPRKRVALTFDDGPQHYNNEETKAIVDELAKYGYHATFFVVGNRVAGGDAVSYAIEAGNEVGIHGYTHSVYYDECNDDTYQREINNTAQAILAQVPNYQIRLMRPVGGKITDERIQTCPYAVILWSVDSDDWNNTYHPGISDEDAETRVNTIVENVMSEVQDGDIILMHDIYQSTYDATKIILARLYEEGYDVVTVSELLGNDLATGRVYSSAYDK